MSNSALTVLCVDDDKVDRQAIIRSVKKSEITYDVLEAEDLKKAITICNNSDIHCVILDYQMPGEDGIEGIKKLLELNPFLVIVMVTGQGNENVAVEALKQGALDYIPKDQITEITIKKVIQNAIEKASLQKKINEQQEQLKNFSRILAHDFMAPTRSIKHFVSFLIDDIASNDFENISDYVSRIDKSIGYMDELINSLRGYHNADDTIQMKSISLQEVVDCALTNLSADIETKDAQISCGPLPETWGDYAQLIELFQNLIANGLKFSEEQTPTVHISCCEQGANWKITVKDNGIGIKEENLDSIFKPFRRLHGVDQYPGTGLGLSVCKKIVERHGGKIWCSSEFGQGCEFIFTLKKSTDC